MSSFCISKKKAGSSSTERKPECSRQEKNEEGGWESQDPRECANGYLKTEGSSWVTAQHFLTESSARKMYGNQPTSWSTAWDFAKFKKVNNKLLFFLQKVSNDPQACPSLSRYVFISLLHLRFSLQVPPVRWVSEWVGFNISLYTRYMSFQDGFFRQAASLLLVVVQNGSP